LLDYVLYDSQKLANGTNEHTFFVEGKGKPFTVGGNKTLADSNVVATSIPNNQRLKVYAIKTLIVPPQAHDPMSESVYADLVDMLTSTTVTWRVEGKDRLLQMTLQEMLGDNYPITILPSVAGDNINTNTLNMIRTAYPLNVPIPLAALTIFQGDMVHQAGVAATLDDYKVKFSLQGKFERLA
jgi:hypothetical protein